MSEDKKQVFLNDKLVESDKAYIPAADSGFLYGAGLFETMRSYGGAVFCLGDHLDRLFLSAEKLGINNTYEKDFIADAIYKTLGANKLSDGRLRLTLSSGSMSPVSDQQEPTLLISAVKLQPYPPEYYKNGVLVVLCPYKQNPYEPTCGHKTTSYFPRMAGLKFAHSARAAEALWFTVDNRLAEGCVSNVFLVKDSVLSTPRLDTPILPGVARKTVCSIAKSQGIGLVEKDLYIDDVLGADEIFLTNVVMQIMPVSRVEKHTVGEGQVGPIVKKLQKGFEEFIKSECGQCK